MVNYVNKTNFLIDLAYSLVLFLFIRLYFSFLVIYIYEINLFYFDLKKLLLLDF